MILLSLILFSAQAAAAGSDPYSTYLNSIKGSHPDAIVSRVAKECGVDPGKATVVYGAKLGHTWSRTSSLKVAFGKVDSDFFASAELWRIGGIVRIARFWDLELDTGSEIDSVVCLDPMSRVVLVHASDWNISVAAGPEGWGFQRDFVRNSSGEPASREGRFTDTQGRPIQATKLDDDEKRAIDSPLKPEWFKSLGTLTKEISNRLR